MGAGASAGCLSAKTPDHPPDWNKLLLTLSTQMAVGTERAYVEDLIAKERYLDAAEIVKEQVTPGDFQRVLRATFSSPDYAPSEMHKSIYDLDAKIVITTNYDQIYEKYCSTFSGNPYYNTLQYFDQNLLDEIRSDGRLLLKAHGCISSTDEVVLGRSSYFEAKRSHPGFYAILDTLFLTHTILFLGASMTDPDIQLVLENATIAVPSANKHFAVVPSGTHPSLIASAEKTYNLKFLNYPVHDYADLNASLTDLATRVEDYRNAP